MSEQDIMSPRETYAVPNPLVNVLEVNLQAMYVTDEQGFEQGESDRNNRQTQTKKYRAFRDIIAADGSKILTGEHFDAIKLGGHANCEILAQRGLVSILDDEQVRKMVEAVTSEYILAKSIVWRKPFGVGDVGTAAKAEFLAAPSKPARSQVDVNTGHIVHLAAEPGDDGTEALQNLIEKGYVIKNPAFEAPRAKRSKS